MALTWLRLDLRRRWRSLVVLALLVALSAGVVLTAVAGARRGDTAFGRLWARTLPATVVVLPNQPGFDWAKVRALPEVSALGLFAVYYGAAVEGMDGVDLGFPPANADALQTVERPVVLAGRMASPGRADEAVVTPHFLTAHHKQVGDILTLRLSTPAQAAAGIDASQTPPAGPRVTVRIVGVIKTPFGLDSVGDSGGVIPTYALLTRYRADIMGTNTSNSPTYLNGLIRLAGGEAAIPAFRADLARVTGRSDIDVLDENIWIGDPARKVTGYEAACLLAFGLAALLAALVLVGQSVARYASAAVAELLVLRAVGLTRRQAASSAALAPGLAAVAGATLGVAAAIVASNWMPIGAASLAEPSPGISADWLVLGAGWAASVLLVLAATAAIAWTALRAGPAALARRSPAVAAGARAGLPVPAIVGARFALEPGRGRAAVPVRPAIAGAVAGVLGVLAALTFSAGISDAVRNPARFGQTWQLETFYGADGQDFAPAGAASRAAAADRDVTGFLDVRIAGAQAGRVSIESFTYAPVDGKRVPMVLTAGRMPASPGEIALAPTTARELGAAVGADDPARRRPCDAHHDRLRHRLRPERAAQQLRPGRLADPGRVRPAVRRRALRVQVPRGGGRAAARRGRGGGGDAGWTPRSARPRTPRGSSSRPRSRCRCRSSRTCRCCRWRSAGSSPCSRRGRSGRRSRWRCAAGGASWRCCAPSG